MSQPRGDADRPALIHDFFVSDGGAEACAVEFANLLPTATVHTTFFSTPRFGGRIDPGRVRPWPLQGILGAPKQFRALLPLYPIWFTALDVRDRPLVLSSSIAFSKATRASRPPSGLHISYVYTPIRYAWDLETYLSGSSVSLPARIGSRLLRPALQRWDVATAERPDVVVAISRTVQERIRRLWHRESELIYPPVDTSSIPVSPRDDGFLLVASRMLAYRRLDLAIAAATRLKRKLVVVGDGPEEGRLQSIAGPTVRFLGRVDRATLLDLFGRCHAYVVPGIEDFGIAPVEAMAAGKPVVGFGVGGVAETVIDGTTGVLFERADVESLCLAIERMDGIAFDRAAIRRRAEEFDTEVFRARWRELFARFGVDPSLYSER